MIIDAHAHLETRILPLADLLASMDASGIARTILIPLLTDPPETRKGDFPLAVQRSMFYHPWLRPLGIAITRSMYRERGQWNMWLGRGSDRPQRFTLIAEPDNRSVAEAVARHPERLSGWIFVNPCLPGALEEIERWRSVPGMVGIKLHPFWHQFAMSRAEGVFQRAEELGLPVLMHLGFEDYRDFLWLPERHPRLKLVLAHLAIPFYGDAWSSFGRHPNVFFDLASTYHVDRRLVRAAAAVLGPDKLVFGTDRPYAHPDADRRILGWVDELRLPDPDREKVLSGNIRRLLGI